MPHSLGHTITPSGQAERVQTNDGREPTQMMLEEGDGVNGWACANLDAVGERSCSRRKLVLDLVGRWSLSDLGPRGYKGLVLTKSLPIWSAVRFTSSGELRCSFSTAHPHGTPNDWFVVRSKKEREREYTCILHEIQAGYWHRDNRYNKKLHWRGACIYTTRFEGEGERRG